MYVGRPTKLGNPFSIAEYGRERSIANYRGRMAGLRLIAAVEIEALRGKDLACWCPLDQPCHADVLLEIANGESNA